MQPLLREFVGSVVSFAFVQTHRARANFHPDYEGVSVRTEITGPISDTSSSTVLDLQLLVTLTPRSEEREVEERSIRVIVDVAQDVVRAPELGLPELPLDRSALARVTAALEAWCVAQLPREQPLGC